MPLSRTTIFIVFGFLFFSTFQSYAGLVLERQRYEEGASQKTRGTIYMQDNKIKSFDEEGQFSAIFDLDTVWLLSFGFPRVRPLMREDL